MNFFKNKKDKQIELAVAAVQEIHKKVLSGGDLALQEANNILNQTSEEDYKRYVELEKFNFGSSEEVKDAKIKLEQINYNRKKVDTIKRYQTLYPQKFILTEDMEAICKQYNLVLGPNKFFTGSIPPRSRDEIIRFKLRDEDVIHYMGTIKITKSGIEKSQGYFEWEEITKDQFDMMTNFGEKLRTGIGRSTKQFIRNSDFFYVAAPDNMFDQEHLVKEGVNFKEKVEVDDPVCLCPVQYGYLIVSVWGEEIAIKRLQNEKNN